MQDIRHNLAAKYTHLFYLSLLLLIALAMRVYDLGRTPLGVHYDEAANVILANEIAEGARPIFIKGYTGKEVLYFYLAAAAIRLIGHPLIAVRVASALIGVVSVAITYRTARELFCYQQQDRGAHIALIAAALQAMNLWAITVSRLGFRALVQPPLQAVTFLFLFRGLRQSRSRGWADWIWAGICCGMAAYTYLAIRAFPIVVAFFLLWILALVPALPTDAPTGWPSGGRSLRLAQIGVFLLAAAIVFAPLGIFYGRNPQFFANRMGQVSVFAAEGGGDAPLEALWHAVKVSFAMFIVRGDLNWRFNVAGAPALWWPWAVFFVVGLVVGIQSLFRRARTPTHAAGRTTTVTLLLWLPVMLLPSILGGSDVEISLSLRAIGVMPAIFFWPALGLIESTSWLKHLLMRWLSPESSRRIVKGVIAVMLLVTGVYTAHQCFNVWGPSVPGYYAASAYLVDAARYLNAHLPPEADIYVSAEHYRHPTMALVANRYADIKWLVGPDVLVFPMASGKETQYVFTHEAMPPEATLARFFDQPDEQVLAPDGQTAFRVYHFSPDRISLPRSGTVRNTNLGNALRFIGYEMNTSPVSGGTMDITIFFEATRDGERDDYAFFVHLADDQGFSWGGKTFFTYPSIQWKRGEVMVFRCTFPIWVGAPPSTSAANYSLDVGVYSASLDARLPVLNDAGQMVGTTLSVGGFDIQRAETPAIELPPMQKAVEVSFEDELTLLGFDRDRGDLRPGETLAISLYWQTGREIGEDYRVVLWLEGQAGSMQLWDGYPVRGQYPFSEWQPNEFVRDRYALRLPADAPAGDFELLLALLRPDGTRVSFSGDRDSVPLGTIHVQATDRLWEPPPYAHPVDTKLGDGERAKVELLGYDLDRQEAGPGEAVHLTLVWRCLDEMQVAYTVFTHLLDTDERVRGQKDNVPMNGSYPTTLWAAGEVVVDEYEIEVRPDTPPGPHVIEVGMYDPANMQRLLVLDPTGTARDRILLGEIQVLGAD